MEAKDLRIGNYVNLRVKDESWFGPVTSIEDGGARLNGIYAEYRLLFPIPLTLEVLEACGFVWDSGDEDNKWLRLAFRHFRFESDESVEFKRVYVIAYGKEITYVCYLHELQNLFYCLTGQELAVSLPVNQKNSI